MALSDETRAYLENLIGGLRTSLESKIDVIAARLTSLETTVVELSIETRIMSAKMANSNKTRDDVLERVPLSSGAHPDNEYPTIAKLLVAGNEKLPSGVPNDWNAQKSLRLIREYDPAYETDDEGAVNVTSRRRRLKLAQHLGLSTSQLNMSMTSLYFA